MANPDPTPWASSDLAKALTKFANSVSQQFQALNAGLSAMQVPPGVAVATAGSAAAQTGATTAPGLVTATSAAQAASDLKAAADTFKSEIGAIKNPT